MNAVQLIRKASRVEAERNELEDAMLDISRIRIMDTVSAIRMRAIAAAILTKLQRVRGTT